jgi:hypothetical protein
MVGISFSPRMLDHGMGNYNVSAISDSLGIHKYTISSPPPEEITSNLS